MPTDNVFALCCFSLTFITWSIHELYIEKYRNTNKQDLSKELKFNNMVMVVGTSFSMLLMLSLLVFNLFTSSWLFSVPWISIAGSTLALIGVYIRWYAVRTLKEHFDANIQIKKNQELIQHGLFRYIRHPSYTGSWLSYVGLGIASLNVVSAFVLSAFISLAYFHRIRLEERVLIDGFGESYLKYRENTGALFPKCFGFLVKRQKTDHELP